MINPTPLKPLLLSPTHRFVAFVVALCCCAIAVTAHLGQAGTLILTPQTPSSRTEARLFFQETDWGNECPPEVATVVVSKNRVDVRLVLPAGCVPTLGDNPYSVATYLPKLDPGSYLAVVEAPDFTTGQPEFSQLAFEVTDAVSCQPGHRPSASLLLPYFESDLDDSEGQKTLFALGTVANRPTLVHVVLWTNFGWPRLSFDTVLPPNGMKTFDTASILAGNWPDSSPPGDGTYPNCTSPLERPTVDPAALRALFTGQPSLDDGLCYSAPSDNPNVATGYVTVDVVRDCSGTETVVPWDVGYFEEDTSASLATQDNVLWGDFYLVDSAQDLAEGETLVSLYADDTLYGVSGDTRGGSFLSFYRDHDHRMPLAHASRARFLDGGAFSADTEVLVWFEGTSGPNECDAPPDDFSFYFVGFELFDEQGGPIADEVINTQQHVRRYLLGENAPLTRPFGILDVDTTYVNGVIGVPLIEKLQSWMLPIVRAQNRFGIASGSMPLEDFCRP
ncbi:MAG: hypothetical protein K8J08_13810 [Thermoanaerobaculia bacterium]|nr:hypothetical protein [Thermoanaerobaculia bacterium]